MRSAVLATIILGACQPRTALEAPSGGNAPWFREGRACIACHERITTADGEDVSFGSLWQASIMANSSRDPYWQAAVRREITDHPSAQAEIEEECARCHMPMRSERARFAGEPVRLFENLPGRPEADPLAVDGVACSLCHQISRTRLGEPSSFTGGFVIEPKTWPTLFGPYELTPAQTSLMRSTLGALPTQGLHVTTSELCATCHTLYTRARDASGHEVARFPEQVPFLEWQHSDYRERQSCQACHMPRVAIPTPITSVAATPRRPELSRHDFRGANFFMLGMLDRHRDELAVAATPSAMQVAIDRTRGFLEHDTARVSLAHVARDGARVVADVVVENLTGHKLPTAYPSRRAWLHVTLRDATGRVRFESGRLLPTGAIDGNDNDVDATTFERHHTAISSPDDVQIYEPILGDAQGHVTTGLINAVTYLKDNRLLPHGFDKATAAADIAVHGDADDDPDFIGGTDEVHYTIDAGDAPAPLTLDVELIYQPIGFRWAHNLAPYGAAEPQRFVRFYDEMAAGTAITLASAHAAVR